MTVKDQVREIVDHLPDNCTLEDVMYRLYVLEKIRRGVESAENEPKTPHKTVMKEMREWLMKSHGPTQPAKI
jgi:hypothetical protein